MWTSTVVKVLKMLCLIDTEYNGYRFYPSNSFQLGVPFVELEQGARGKEVNGNDVLSCKFRLKEM